MTITPSPVSIDEARCQWAGQILSSVEFRPEFYKRPFLSKPLPEPLRLSMIWFSVVVCHQTAALGNEGLNLYGWDFLEYGFLRIASENKDLLDPNQVARMTPTKLGKALAPWFSPDGSCQASTLDRIGERSRLMIASARFLADVHQGSVRQFLASTRQQLVGHPLAYYTQLSRVEPFTDPLLKKATFMLKLLSDAALFEITDSQNLIPVMDYHMQRVLLRTGCVTIHNESLRYSLTHQLPLASDAAVREASVDAMRLIAKASALPVMLMNDIFYMLGRSCCLDAPLCQSGICAKDPCSLTLTLHLPQHHSCLLQACCAGVADPAIRLLWHPVVATHYY